MKLEGVAEIELTNVHTGEKERYVEKNMVTNALQEILGKNRYLMSNRFNIENTFLPLYKKALGGIFVFDNTIEEDPNIMIPPANVECIGHAGDAAYAGKNERRGQINTTETTLLDDGAKLVWDFGTDKANGTIKCICLTNAIAGNGGLGNETVFEGGKLSYEIGRSNTWLRTENETIPSVFDEEYAYLASSDGDSNGYKITRYDVPCNKIKIMQGEIIKEVDTHRIEIGKMSGSSTTYYVRLNGMLYLMNVSSTTSKKGFILSEVNLKTFKSTIHDYSGLNVKPDKWNVLGGYIYFSQPGEKTTIYKMNINNPTDLTKIEVDRNISSIGVFGNMIAISTGTYYNYFLNEKGKILKTEGETQWGQLDDNTKLFFVRNNSSANFGLYVRLSYLATINNLATPVIKTADKTMKITYTIREKLE